MKKLLLPLSFLFVFTLIGKATTNDLTNLTVTQNAQFIANPLKIHFDKGLKMSSHKRGFKTVEHTADDYMKFNADKTYIQSYNGKVIRGKWTYDKTTNEVTIILNNNVTHVYKIDTCTDDKVELSNNTERITLKP